MITDRNVGYAGRKLGKAKILFCDLMGVTLRIIWPTFVRAIWLILSELFGRILSAIFGILVPIVVRPITGLSGAASANFFLTRSVDLENSQPPPINSESDTHP
jgi:hypothetical protein